MDENADPKTPEELQQEREAALEAKEQLMRELNHRVKNNLNMVSSLINLKDATLGPAADLSDISSIRLNRLTNRGAGGAGLLIFLASPLILKEE